MNFPLDVNIADGIARAPEVIEPVSVLVDNAGIELLDTLDGTSMDMGREVVEIDTLVTRTRPSHRDPGSGARA